MTFLATTREFQDRRDAQIMKVHASLHNALTNWLDSRVLSRHTASLRRRVIHPAIDLQQLMFGYSRVQYRLNAPPTTSARSPGIANTLVFRDISTFKEVNLEESHKCFGLQYPGIQREGPKTHDWVTLVKPVMLVIQTRKLNYNPAPHTLPLEPSSTGPSRHGRRHNGNSTPPHGAPYQRPTSSRTAKS